MPGDWVIGVLVNNVWSIAGTSTNNFLLQYFINYNFGKTGWYLTTAPIITADWKAASGQRWIVPFGAGGGKIVRVGKLPLNINASAYYNVVHPDIGPLWQLRVQVAVLLPASLNLAQCSKKTSGPRRARRTSSRTAQSPSHPPMISDRVGSTQRHPNSEMQAAPARPATVIPPSDSSCASAARKEKWVAAGFRKSSAEQVFAASPSDRHQHRQRIRELVRGMEQVVHADPQHPAGDAHHDHQDGDRAQVLAGPVQPARRDQQDQEDAQVGEQVHRVGEQEQAAAGVRGEQLHAAGEHGDARRERHPRGGDVREVVVVLVRWVGPQDGKLYASLARDARCSTPASLSVSRPTAPPGVGWRREVLPSPRASAMTRNTSVLSM